MPGEQPNPEINPEDQLRTQILADLEKANIVTRQVEGAYIHEGTIGDHAIKLTTRENTDPELEIDGQLNKDPDLIQAIVEKEKRISV